MRDRDPLDAAGEIGRPGDDVGIVAANFLNHRKFLRREILVTSELLEHAESELGIAVLELGADRIGPISEQAFTVAFNAEASSEGAAAFLHRHVSVVEDRAAGVFQLGSAPARP